MNLKRPVCEFLGKNWRTICDVYWDDVDICKTTRLIARPGCPEIETARVLKRKKPTVYCGLHKPGSVPAPGPGPASPEWPQAPDYDGRLIGMTAYSLIKYPLADIEWFLRELVKAGGNATEALFVTTWDGTWEWQPYKRVKWERKKWATKPWNIMGPKYGFPVYDLSRWNEDAWAKWRAIFTLAEKMNITLCIRVQDFCSRKDNFLERHWAFWSCIQSWRWGGPMGGGYLHWPPGEGGGGKYIWPHYDRLNKRLIAELKESGVKYFLEDWNELYWTPGSQVPANAPAPLQYQYEVQKWFLENFKAHGCPPDRLISNPERIGKYKAETAWLAGKLRQLGAHLELHGCASPENMRTIIAAFGAGRHLFPNGDGTDKYAKGINDGRPNYTEPSYAQAVEMGRILKRQDLFGYIFKGRRFRRTQNLRRADFTAVRGLAKGLRD